MGLIDSLIRKPGRGHITWLNQPGKNGQRFKQQTVKNLGWLLKHQNDAVQVELKALDEGKGELIVYGVKHGSHGEYDWLYQCTFESFSVMLDWYKRRKVLLRLPAKMIAQKNGVFTSANYKPE